MRIKTTPAHKYDHGICIKTCHVAILSKEKEKKKRKRMHKQYWSWLVYVKTAALWEKYSWRNQ